MWRISIVLLTMVYLIGGCTSVPNVTSSDEEEQEKNWGEVVGSLLPSDPVPKEIKLNAGNYIVAEIQHVRDGDTLTVYNLDTSQLTNDNHEKQIEDELRKNEGSLGVRFISIDAPEITNGKEEYYGVEAKDAVEKLLYNDKVILEIDPLALFDNYGRLIAHVYTTEGASVQKYLLSNGLARVAYLYDDYKYTRDYREAEKNALNKKLNIHSIDGYVKWDEIAGYDMNAVEKPRWNLIEETPAPEEVVEKLSELEFFDFFNFGISGSR